MIREYAIDPQVILKCQESMTAQIMRISFGVGTHRIPCIVPNRSIWISEVMESIKAQIKAGKLPPKGAATQRIFELAKHFVGPNAASVERAVKVEAQHTSLHYIEKEHKIEPFYAVIHSMSAQKGNDIFGDASIDSDFLSCSRWDIESKMVRKTKADVLEALRVVIKYGSRFEFIDRNFYPGPDPLRDKWKSILLEVLWRAFTSRPADRANIQFVIHTTKDKNEKTKEPLDPLKMKSSWAPYIPAGCTLELKLHESDELDNQVNSTGLRWHDRYLYTDMGCIYFGPGWDEDDTHEGVMGVLPRKDAERVRQQYCGDRPSFRYVKGIGIHIDGTAAI